MPNPLFLVLLRCNLDDLPLGIFETQDAAVTFCQGLTLRQAERVQRLLTADRSEYLHLSVVRFLDNVPVGELEVELPKALTEDPDVVE